MNLTYLCNVQPDESKTDQKLPFVDSWEVTNFTNYNLILKVNFGNALYVSSAARKDEISLQILNSNFFLSYLDNEKLIDNYTLDAFIVPSQAKSEEDFQTLNQVGNSA